MDKVKVGILGATGAVGQRFVQLLSCHPFFEIAALGASSRSAGKKYSLACRWYLEGVMPDSVRDMIVVDCVSGSFPADVKIVFSALPAESALDVEADFASNGFYVFSNTRSYRMHEDVPLVIPEVNPGHFSLIDLQKKNRGWKGAIITNPNCSTIMLALALKPLYDAFGIDKVIVSTMQALSGAGYPGVPSMGIVDNVIPYIGGEEEKIATESRKILGGLSGDSGCVVDAPFLVSASCHRVCVTDGHLLDVHVGLGRHVSVSDVVSALESFSGEPQKLGLPSAPNPVIVVRSEDDRPQPRLDRMSGNGMSVVVGRVRADDVLSNGIKFNVLGHNTIRGAAGASILNAELFLKKYRVCG